MNFDHLYTGLPIAGALIGTLATALLLTPTRRRIQRWVLLGTAVLLAGLCEVLAWNPEAHRWHQQALLFCGVLIFLVLGSMVLRERLLTHRRRWKQADQRRSVAEKRWGSMVRHTPLIVVELDAEHVVREWNPAATRLFGYTREEAVGKSMVALVIPADKRARVTEELRQAGYQEEGTHQVHQSVARDGRTVTCQWHITPVARAGGAAPQIYCVLHDITDAMELETKLRHSQKLESIGLLAAGVAHDFNNMLTIIQGHADLLRNSLTNDHTESAIPLEREHCECIAYAADRASALTKQLLSFSRQQAMIPVHLDMNELVERCTRMLSRLVGPNINIQLGLAGALPQVHCDPNLLEQVITNLVVNARDAMPKGGRIRITTSTMPITPDRMARNPGAQTGQAVCLSVMDSGTGIQPDKMDRIFEPFFTTKGPGKGTGLGLAAVHGIVEQHGGWIEVRSWMGRGTIFCVFLKAAAPSVAGMVRQIQSAPASQIRRSTLADFTVLVVDDEEILRDLCQTVLEDAGCRVLVACDGPHAVQVWEQHADEIDVLFTDMMMPGGMTGYDVAERLRRDRPALPVVFCSGYSPETTQLTETEGEQLIFLQKPYRQPGMVEALHTALARRPKPAPKSSVRTAAPKPASSVRVQDAAAKSAVEHHEMGDTTRIAC